MQLLLDVPKELFTEAQPNYLRVLAFNNRGRQLLAQMRTEAALPVITKLGRSFASCLTGDAKKDAAITAQLSLDIKAANLLALLQNSKTNAYNSDYLQQPIYLQS